MEYVLVSGCLLGINCRYDGKNSLNLKLLEKLKDFAIVPVCPEQLGGLTTPRPPAQITAGSGEDVIDEKSSVRTIEENIDVTQQYVRGAEEVLKIARLFDVKQIFLKEKSPACGVNFIKRDGEKLAGMGVAAALLRLHGYKLHSVD